MTLLQALLALPADQLQQLAAFYFGSLMIIMYGTRIYMRKTHTAEIQRKDDQIKELHTDLLCAKAQNQSYADMYEFKVRQDATTAVTMATTVAVLAGEVTELRATLRDNTVSTLAREGRKREEEHLRDVGRIGTLLSRAKHAMRLN